MGQIFTCMHAHAPSSQQHHLSPDMQPGAGVTSMLLTTSFTHLTPLAMFAAYFLVPSKLILPVSVTTPAFVSRLIASGTLLRSFFENSVFTLAVRVESSVFEQSPFSAFGEVPLSLPSFM